MTNQFTSDDHFARHGGVHFSPNASAEEINQFVNEMPVDQRDSFYEVIKSLSDQGLITLHNDGILADGEGQVGGSNDC
ncbi:hypothetical protein [Marininema halotolerans]|uniref:Uncharacterized protein n=1 Tax=Marininema halotolerans TaxID=1155944 RepID=A0A1I6P8R2_9BACL|nr:hypothetical protein [Marininema halotolerans]SFS36488.1 hypothetical protein SAMN05444972_101428 [Marininema halotolerans]